MAERRVLAEDCPFIGVQHAHIIDEQGTGYCPVANESPPEHPGPPPPPAGADQIEVDAWQYQWDQYRRWHDDEEFELRRREAVRAARDGTDDLDAEIAENERQVRLRLFPEGWRWRITGCAVEVPDTSKPAWLHRTTQCGKIVAGFLNQIGGVYRGQFHGACAEHLIQARVEAPGPWLWAHDATSIERTPADEIEAWLAMYALGWNPDAAP